VLQRQLSGFQTTAEKEKERERKRKRNCEQEHKMKNAKESGRVHTC
jgi:hypothetical protein